ncbi:antibiotic biosynthesis monooxygenase, partial [Aeromonas hydrophila]|nr:antibiotic biosynthesis monooxygenase [Aeromonas hydrophila]
GSPQYQQWKALLHHFYDPFPTVEHYRQVTFDETEQREQDNGLI